MFLGWLLVTYLIGSIPFGVVLTALYGGDIDIRAAGSGNIGATNVARVYGWRLAAAALLLDAAKGALPTLGAMALWPGLGLGWLAVVAGVAFVGHCYSIYLDFQGGKGVATGAGGMLVLSPWATLLAVGLWLVVLRVSGRSSVAALSASLGLVGITALLDPPAVPFVALLAIAVIARHVTNIQRLVAGDEARVLQPARWGRRPSADPAELLEQAPSGQGPAPPVWREVVSDPLEPTEEVPLERATDGGAAR